MPTGSRMLTTKPVANIALRLSGDKAGIFEDAEQQQIAGDANREHGKAQTGVQFARDQEIADAIIERDRPSSNSTNCQPLKA